MAEFSPKFKEALSLVQKPGRYTGGEPGSVYKDKDKVDVRMAFCFPDTYEIGMSFLGEKILYDILNRHENWWCERAFMPWTDMKEQMERLDIPLYCLESKDPLTMSRLKTLWCLWSALCRIAPASRCCAAVCAAAGFARQASCTVPSASAAPSLSARAPASFAATPAMTS